MNSDPTTTSYNAGKINVARGRYAASPKSCPACSKQLSYEQRMYTCCSHSCAAKICKNRAGTGAEVVAKSCPCGAPVSGRGNKFCDGCIANGGHLGRKPLSELKTDASRRTYLLRTRGHQCESCERTEWMGQIIPIEMDHADGDHTNNDEINLRLLCPNCHALSPYHKGANKGRGRTKRKAKTMNTNPNSDTDCGPDTHGVLAQLVAQPVVDRKAAGSSPAHPATEATAR